MASTEAAMASPSTPEPPARPFSGSPGVAASPRTSTAKPKEFRCSHHGCTKSFTRAEHLHRHALNHEETRGTACQRCSAVFKRSDLLERHMARHKEKDAEAGGEGLGKLLTRKRLWRDSTGAIVSKRRPEHEREKKRSAPDSESLPARPIQSHPHLKDSSFVLTPTPQKDVPISPPRSSEPVSNGSDFGEPFPGTFTLPIVQSAQLSRQAVMEDQWAMPNPTDEMPFEDAGFDSYEFLCNAAWGFQPSRVDCDLPYNEIFSPHTGNSFDMPLTTISYYSWLFGNDPWPGNAPAPASITSNYSSRIGAQDAAPLSGHFNDYPRFHPQPLRHHRKQSTHILPPIGSTSSTEQLPSLTSAHGVPPFAEFLAMSRTPEPNRNYPLRELHDDTLPESSTTQTHGIGQRTDRYVLTPDLRSAQDSYRAIPRSRQPRRLPVIDELARENILRFIDSARPKTSDGYEIARDHPLLSPSTLQHFSDLFFRRFNTSYSLLHQATFVPSQADPLLLLAVLQLGASYSTKDDHHFAICIHNTMRSQIFGHIAFTNQPALWMLQTILLVECFGKLRGGQLQHDMSHLFHGLLINLIRRSDCQLAQCQIQPDVYDLESRWRAEVDAEQRRRLALLCFMWDTQNAVFFSQSLCMNVAELRLSLPWDPALWGAATAEEWHSINLAQRPSPSYLSVLKACINPETDVRLPQLNGLSRVLILHGLMSVAWDLNRRDQTSFSTALAGTDESWQSRIARSYETWKSDFELYSRDVLQSLDELSSEKAEFQRFNTATLAIYHSAHIILNVDIIDLQIYAGAHHILGRQVLQADRERSRHKIEQWAKPPSMVAAQAASHSALLLRDGIRKLYNWDAGDVFHYPWCLYLATLTCWAFQTASKISMDSGFEGANDGVQSGNDDDADWDSKAEMNALVSAMTRARPEELWKVASKYRAGDLPRVVAKQLSTVRWAVVQEGMIVLRSLVKRKHVR